MRTKRFIKLLESMTYKAAHKIRFHKTRHNSVHFELEMTVTCSKDQRVGTFQLTFSQIFDEHQIDAMSTKIAKQILYDFIKRAEVHECQEWLKFKGKQYIDPHDKPFPNQL